MPRPRKRRRVCGLPGSNLFGPLNIPVEKGKLVTMTVEEYEAIRLIDLEGLTQEEAAKSMGVARTTVQRIYSEARTKLAQSLVNMAVLKIEGGDYKLCDTTFPKICGRKRCHRHGRPWYSPES